MEVKGYGKLELLVKQPDGIETATLKKVKLVPELGRNLLSAKQSPRTSGREIRICNDEAFPRSSDNACRFHSSGSGLDVMEAQRISSSGDGLCCQAFAAAYRDGDAQSAGTPS